MHVVFLNQYYPPDAAPTGVMLEGLVQGMLAAGHEVTVLCTDGGYAAGDTTDGHPAEPAAVAHPALRIIRIGATNFGRGTFGGKLLDYASYYLWVAWKLCLLQPQPTRIVALTTPPYLAVLARLISKFRRADHAHWVMDLYPDVMVAHRMLGERSLVCRILAGLTRWGFGGKRCAAVLTLGPDMAARVRCRMGAAEAADIVQWVPLWGMEETSARPVAASDDGAGEPPPGVADPCTTVAAQSLRQRRGWGANELIVMYSGNMGLGHRFTEILTASLELTLDSAEQPVRMVFFGKGKRRVEIASFIREHQECAVELHDYAPAKGLVTHLQSADVHLASLDPAWTGTMVPSKVQGIFAAGRPVIFIGSAESSIGQWVHESGGGWVVTPDYVDGVLAAIAESRQPAVRLAKGAAAQLFARRFFDKTSNVARMVAVLVRDRRGSR